MNPFNHFKGTSFLDQAIENRTSTQAIESRTSTQAQNHCKQMDPVEKKAAVHEEMKRMNQLPANSTYATHRLRVLNKILQLMSIEVNNHWNNIFNVKHRLIFLGLITSKNTH